jgi:hypothetical protein
LETQFSFAKDEHIGYTNCFVSNNSVLDMKVDLDLNHYNKYSEKMTKNDYVKDKYDISLSYDDNQNVLSLTYDNKLGKS